MINNDNGYVNMRSSCGTKLPDQGSLLLEAFLCIDKVFCRDDSTYNKRDS